MIKFAPRIAAVMVCCAALLFGSWGNCEASAATLPPTVLTNSQRTITDEVGRRVTLPSEVNRIVSLAPDLTELVYDLGLADHLAGDTSYCDTPAEAKLKPHVGSPQNPSLEAIVGLRPDLVLATTSINRLETVEALARLGIAVYTSDPHTVRGMLNSFQRIAELTGAGKRGNELVGGLRRQLDGLQTRLADRPLVHVLFVVWESPLISIGQKTFIADALRWAGAESVVISNQNWPTLSFEEVVRLQPDYLIFAHEHTGEAPVELEQLRKEAGWKDLEAVQSGHVAIVADAIDRPSPGMIAVIDDLARQLHPEVFSSVDMSGNSFAGLRTSHCSADDGGAAGKTLVAQEPTACAL